MTAIPPPDKILSGARLVIDLVKNLGQIRECLQPFKPDVISVRFDYLEKGGEVKYLLRIPGGIPRLKHRTAEIPAVAGFRVHEMWGLDTLKRVDSSWTFEEGKWILRTDELPSDERYWLVLKGRVSADLLSQLVSVRAAENPSRDKGIDKYWIHSAIKDVSIFEAIWTELNIERVSVDVRIGVERFFTSAIPREVMDRLEVTRQLLDAIASGDRGREQRLHYRFRTLQRIVKLSPQSLYDLILKLVSGDFFANFVHTDKPFVLASIEPERQFAVLIPERVKVGVQSDLSFLTPAAEGNLNFEREKYVKSISDEIKGRLPKKKKIDANSIRQ